jgi:hypothetical protein
VSGGVVVVVGLTPHAASAARSSADAGRILSNDTYSHYHTMMTQ